MLLYLCCCWSVFITLADLGVHTYVIFFAILNRVRLSWRCLSGYYAMTIVFVWADGMLLNSLALSGQIENAFLGNLSSNFHVRSNILVNFSQQCSTVMNLSTSSRHYGQ